MAMDADLSVDKIEINPADVAATMSATQPSIHIAPVKKPKPITKPKPHATADWLKAKLRPGFPGRNNQ